MDGAAMKDWVGQLEKSLRQCYDSRAEDEMEALRDLHSVLDAAPPVVTRIFGRPLTSARFEKLAELNACETIARELSQPGLIGFLVSGSREGRYIATVKTGHSDEEFIGDGKTEALAYSCALTKAIHRVVSKGERLELKAVER